MHDANKYNRHLHSPVSAGVKQRDQHYVIEHAHEFAAAEPGGKGQWHSLHVASHSVLCWWPGTSTSRRFAWVTWRQISAGCVQNRCMLTAMMYQAAWYC